MRTDRRFTRVRDMLLDSTVPRHANGGPALCHTCQREVYFKNGFLQMLVKTLAREAKYPGRFNRPLAFEKLVVVNDEDAAYEAFKAMRWEGGAPTCPSCSSTRSQAIPTRRTWRCKDCNKQYTVTSGTVFSSRKMSFLNIISVCANFETVNSRSLAAQLGVQQGTTWRLSQKLRGVAA